MDAELKDKWVKALRSGEFVQGTGNLKRDGKYCCLGVLCVVKGIKFDARTNEPIDTGWQGKFEYLHPELGGREAIKKLWIKNDEGKSFPEIADYIEANF